MSKKPLVSVIIPAYNEEEHLGKLLTDIKNQTYRKFEVIVVDDLSKDKTVEIAKKFKTKILTSGKHNLSYSRNLGIKGAKGSIVVNLDADFRINKVFLAEIVKKFSDPEVDGVKTKEFLVQDTLTERLDYLRTFFKHGGYTLAVRIFKKGSATYDEDLTCFGEDILINRKLKGKIVLCDEAIIKHHRFHSFREVFKSWKLYPTSFVYYKKYESENVWKGFLPYFLFIFSPVVALHRLVKFRDPVALLIPVYDTVRSVAYIYGTFIMLKKRVVG